MDISDSYFVSKKLENFKSGVIYFRYDKKKEGLS